MVSAAAAAAAAATKVGLDLGQDVFAALDAGRDRPQVSYLHLLLNVSLCRRFKPQGAEEPRRREIGRLFIVGRRAAGRGQQLDVGEGIH